MSQQAVIDLSTKDQQTIATLQRVESAFKKIEDRLDGIAKKSGEAEKATSGIFVSASGDIAKFAAGLAGVGSAAAAVMLVVDRLKAEYQNLVARQKGAADAQLEFEPALAQAVRNAGGAISGAQVRDMAIKLAEEANVAPAKAGAVMSDAFSARGVSNVKQAEEVQNAALAVLQFAPELPTQDAAMFAGTTIDIMKRTGMDARQAVGLTQMTGGVARTTNLKGLAENVMPGAMQMMELGGGTMSENAALMAALTQGIIDPEGAVSRTAGITFVKELRERMPELATTMDRIRKLQSDPKLQKAFLEGGRFGRKKFGAAEIGRGQAQSSVESLIRGSGTASDAFAEFRETLGDVGSAGQQYDQMVREVNSVTATSRIQRVGESATRRVQINDTRAGQVSAIREQMQKFAMANSDSAMQQIFSSYKFEAGSLAGQDPLDQAVSQLSASSRSIRNPIVSGGVGGGPGMPSAAYLTPEQERRAANIDALASEFKALRASLDRNTNATEKNTKDQGPAAPRPITVPSAALGK